MSKNVRFVTVTCACGATFEREVKRGRPQKWCAACLEIPFYDRKVAEPAPVAEGEEVEQSPKSQWDDLAHVRDEIEAGVAEVYENHREAFSALVAEGVDKYVAADQVESILRDGLRDVYAKWGGGKYAA